MVVGCITVKGRAGRASVWVWRGWLRWCWSVELVVVVVVAIVHKRWTVDEVGDSVGL